MDNITILHGTTDDYATITELWEASVRATHDFLSEEDISFFKPLIRNEFLSAVSLRCAKDESGTIHGFLGVADGNIEMLFVHPDSFKKGIGKLLVRHATDEMKATKVDVNEQNTNALSFYKHMGFVTVGRSSSDGFGKPYPLLHMQRA